MSRLVPVLCFLALCVVVAVVLLALARRPRGAEDFFERGIALADAGKYAEMKMRCLKMRCLSPQEDTSDATLATYDAAGHFGAAGWASKRGGVPGAA